MIRQRHHSGDHEGRLLVRVKPVERAEELCRRLTEGVQVVDGVLELDVDLAWSAAINTILVKKGVTVSELRYVGKS